eukprot:2291728-Pyramimonas_sp.AAC.1
MPCRPTCGSRGQKSVRAMGARCQMGLPDRRGDLAGSRRSRPFLQCRHRLALPYGFESALLFQHPLFEDPVL